LDDVHVAGKISSICTKLVVESMFCQFISGQQFNPSKRELVIQCPDNMSDFAAFEEDLDFILHRLNWKGKIKLDEQRIIGGKTNGSNSSGLVLTT